MHSGHCRGKIGEKWRDWAVRVRTFHGLSRTIEEIQRTAGILAQRGWSEASGGNISIRVGIDFPESLGRRMPVPIPVPEIEGKTFIFTRSGSRMRDIAVNPEPGLCLIQVGEGGNYCTVFPDDAKPTSELAVHLLSQAVLKTERPEFTAVLHTQPTKLVALTHITEFRDTRSLNEVLFRMHPETAVILPERTVIVPYEVPGSNALAEKTAHALGDQRVVIWEKHGTVSIGRTLSEALDYVEILEKAAEIYFLAASTNRGPEGLTDEEIERTLRAFGVRL